MSDQRHVKTTEKLCVTGTAAVHLHLQPEGVGLLHGGDSVRGAVLRLGAEGPAGARGGGDAREARHQRAEVAAAHRVAVLRQPEQGGARRHHQAAAGPAESGGGARPDVGEVEGHVG